MIIVKLQGGLGNQMFQYAIGRQLSIINNVSLKLDLSFLLDRSPKEHFTFRNFELGTFNIKADYANDFEVRHFTHNDLISKLRRKFGQTKLINEGVLRFHPTIFNSGENVYLNGYWQCEKYFDSIRAEILNDFTLKESTLNILHESSQLREIKELILKKNSISVHFRRGDYVSDEVTNSFHGICSIQYYQDALKFITEKVQSPHFFLFSDDPEWILKSRIINDFPTTVVTTSNMHLDMYLMSLCQHNIIANSSFSWWGAWLNRNPDKLVIAPQRWYAKDELNPQSQDLIPQNWIRL